MGRVLRVEQRQQRAGAGYTKGVVVDPCQSASQKILRASIAFRLDDMLNALPKKCTGAASHVEHSLLGPRSGQPHHLLGYFRGREGSAQRSDTARFARRGTGGI